ncbi:hypothetical protein PUN28_007828 [Cardiocondyla obscurior]|uniref:Pentatricopeptide repeat-containing protein 1 n=1 Tax=Cardiocondyla obscurior TaxID=286306 RepID=A0AAW2G006_9HYME
MFCQHIRSMIKLKDVIGHVNELNHFIISNQSKNEHLQHRLRLLVDSFCTQRLPKSTNVFGDISGRKFDHVEMDEREKQEENVQDTEGRIPRRFKPSMGQYAKMMKLHISKKDLNSALKVLDLMKENRDQPTMYLYNLLMRSFAMQGDIKQCFSLYNKAKKRGLQPNAATYTCLFNACSVADNKVVALEHLNNLRQSLYQKQVLLNETNYNAMIKAYSWHGKIAEAFQLADEMKDRRISIGEITYNSLFHGAISDKEAGLRHALIVWHLMRLNNFKPSLTTYNLLLRAIRDTKFGNLKPGDVLLSGFDQTKISITDRENPNLLALPPVFSTLVPLKEKRNVMQYNTDANNQKLPMNLNDVLVDNRLILFGGLEGFLNRMFDDDVKPNEKTITLLLDLIPNTVVAENQLIHVAEKNNIELDIDFFNMLIKRRSVRFDYKAAKEVVSIAEKKRLSPNVMTFGVLALGCQELSHAKEFLEGMEAFGRKPNSVIMGTLIHTACHRKNFEYLLFVMKYMVENRIKPSEQTIKCVKDFSQGLSKINKPTGKYRFRKQKYMDKNIGKFEEQYPKWQKMIK